LNCDFNRPASHYLPLSCFYASCRAAIDKLRQQNARLKEDLLLENKFSVRPSNAGATQLINKLQDEADLYTRKVSTAVALALGCCLHGCILDGSGVLHAGNAMLVPICCIAFTWWYLQQEEKKV